MSAAIQHFHNLTEVVAGAVIDSTRPGTGGPACSYARLRSTVMRDRLTCRPAHICWRQTRVSALPVEHACSLWSLLEHMAEQHLLAGLPSDAG